MFARAQSVMPGGVNSPVRAFKGVGGTPVFFHKGQGAWLTDVDGNRYVDYVGSWGPMILGHAFPAILEAIVDAAQRSTSFGAPHPAEIDLAEQIIRAVPSVEKVRLVSSGTEATSSAVRVARGFTSRELIVKMEGCYHGASDAFLVKAGSGVETLGLPDSPGVPRAVARNTLTLPFNDLKAAETLFSEKGDSIACLIIEPVVGNMGVLISREGYLKGLQDLCRKHGTLLIFDEVMTGFRVAYGGAQSLLQLSPDLTTFGKIIGGGLPVGAFGGRRDVMSCVAPEGNVYQAGTLSGNPLAVAAGRACLKELSKPGVYESLEKFSSSLAQGIEKLAREAGAPLTLNRQGSMWTCFHTSEAVYDYPSAKKADVHRFGRMFHALLNEGVYLPPSQFEAGFISLAHGPQELEHTLTAFEHALTGVTVA